MRFTKVHLMALAFVASVLPGAASADGWFSRAGDKKEVTLTDLLKSPREYLDVEVEFKVYFNATGRNYNPYYTQFNEEQFGNFSAYPIDARLYDKRDFPRPYPFFFASKFTKAWKKVKDIDHLRVIEITGVVRHVFKGQPWIEVTSWSGSSGGLSEDDIRDVIRADANFVAGHYADAARLYERADSSRLPASVRADLQRRLGDAYFHAGEYRDAEDAYETGLRCAPDNQVLKLGLAAAQAGYERERAERRGQTVAGEVPGVAPQSQPVVESNGVDEVIRLLEDPAQVQAEVDAWRHELEMRAAAMHGETATAVPVVGREPFETEAEVVEEPAVEPEAVEPEGCAEEPVVEPEGCGEPVVEPEQPVEEPAEQVEPTETTEPMETAEPTETVEPTEPMETEPVETAEPVEPTGGEQPEGCAEGTSVEPVEDTSMTEGCAPEVDEGMAVEGEQACGWTETVEAPVDDAFPWQGEERVVWVSGQMVRLPRLPFFGAEDVTDDDLRAIIEEIVQNPETDE